MKHDCGEFSERLKVLMAADYVWADDERDQFDRVVRECTECRRLFASSIAERARRRTAEADKRWVEEAVKRASQDLTALHRAYVELKLREALQSMGKAARDLFTLEPEYRLSASLSAEGGTAAPEQYPLRLKGLSDTGFDEQAVLVIRPDEIDLVVIPCNDVSTAPAIAFLNSAGGIEIARPTEGGCVAGEPLKLVVWSREHGDDTESSNVLSFPVVGAVLGVDLKS